MPRKRKVKTQEKISVVKEVKNEKAFSWSSLLRSDMLPRFSWEESYVSFLLGIVVVIIALLLIVPLVKSKKIQEVSSTHTVVTPTIPVEQKMGETPVPQIQKDSKGTQTYVVMKNDDLWHIAEKFYKSGYNWVDIAKANNLENPSVLFAGMKLTIPVVAPKVIVSNTVTTPTVVQQANAISGNTYTIQKGDTLWSISVRAYRDGYKWVEIAKANNLTNASLIFSGNVLKLPR